MGGRGKASKAKGSALKTSLGGGGEGSWKDEVRLQRGKRDQNFWCLLEHGGDFGF